MAAMTVARFVLESSYSVIKLQSTSHDCSTFRFGEQLQRRLPVVCGGVYCSTFRFGEQLQLLL